MVHLLFKIYGLRIFIAIIFIVFSGKANSTDIKDVRQGLKDNSEKLRLDSTSVFIEGELRNLKSKRSVQVEAAMLADGSALERRFYDDKTLARFKGSLTFSDKVSILRSDRCFSFSRPRPGAEFILQKVTTEKSQIDRFRLSMQSSLLNYMEACYQIWGKNTLELLDDRKLKILSVEDVKIDNTALVQVKFDARETDRKMLGGTIRFQPDRNWAIVFAESRYFTLETPPAECNDTWTIELGKWQDGAVFPASVENRVACGNGEADVHHKMIFTNRNASRDLKALFQPESWGMPKEAELLPAKATGNQLLKPILFTSVAILLIITTILLYRKTRS